MKGTDLKITELLIEEAIWINGGDNCSCPDCGGGIIGRAIGRFIKFWATADYGRVPVA